MAGTTDGGSDARTREFGNLWWADQPVRPDAHPNIPIRKLDAAQEVVQQGPLVVGLEVFGEHILDDVEEFAGDGDVGPIAPAVLDEDGYAGQGLLELLAPFFEAGQLLLDERGALLDLRVLLEDLIGSGPDGRQLALEVLFLLGKFGQVLLELGVHFLNE